MVLLVKSRHFAYQLFLWPIEDNSPFDKRKIRQIGWAKLVG